MDVPGPIPLPDLLPLAAPPALFRGLLIATFLLHLLPMNFLLGGSILGAFSWIRARRGGNPVHGDMASWLGTSLPIAFAATITFGVAPLLFAQALYGRVLYTSSILMAWSWITVIPALILAYYGTYLLAFSGRVRNFGRTLTAVGVALLLAGVAFIYSNNMSLMLRTEVFPGLYLQESGGTWLNTGDGTLWPRFLHMLLGALAVAGLVLAGYGFARRQKDPGMGDQIVRYGLKIFILFTSLNFVTGTVFLLSYSNAVLLEFLKTATVGTVALLFGFLLGLVAVVLAFFALQARDPWKPYLCLGGTALATLLAMILVRDGIRNSILADRLGPLDWIEPQWSAMGLFAILLAVAAGTIAWMVWALTRASHRPQP